VARRTCRKGDEDEEAVTDVEQLLADAIVRVRVLHAAANESQRRVVQVRNDLNPPSPTEGPTRVVTAARTGPVGGTLVGTTVSKAAWVAHSSGG
jgi:hypothetical protein